MSERVDRCLPDSVFREVIIPCPPAYKIIRNRAGKHIQAVQDFFESTGLPAWFLRAGGMIYGR
jgi:hypothetical protein